MNSLRIGSYLLVFIVGYFAGFEVRIHPKMRRYFPKEGRDWIIIILGVALVYVAISQFFINQRRAEDKQDFEDYVTCQGEWSQDFYDAFTGLQASSFDLFEAFHDITVIVISSTATDEEKVKTIQAFNDAYDKYFSDRKGDSKLLPAAPDSVCGEAPNESD